MTKETVVIRQTFLGGLTMLFKDRVDAGQQLARIMPSISTNNSIVLGLPRGGVPLAIEIAKYHKIECGVILAKKIGHPRNPEYAIGAVAEGGEPIYNQLEITGINGQWLQEQLERIQTEMSRHRQFYGSVLSNLPLKGRDVVIVDDGIATGLTMFAAIEAVKQASPKSLAVAVPIIPIDTYQKLLKTVNAVYVVNVPEQFLGSVGAYYLSFPQVNDQEIQKMLEGFNRD